MDGWSHRCWCCPPTLPGAGPPHRAARPSSGRGGLCFRPSCPSVGVLSVTTLPSYPLAIFALGRARRDLLTHHPRSPFTQSETKAHRGVNTCPSLPTASWAESVWERSLETSLSPSRQRRRPREGPLEERPVRAPSRCGLHTGALHKPVFPRPGQWAWNEEVAGS